jgi:hypothetical protein
MKKQKLHPQQKNRLLALMIFFAVVLGFATALNIFAAVFSEEAETLGISDHQEEVEQQILPKP